MTVLYSEHGGAGAARQKQEDSTGAGSQARPPGHHQVPGAGEEEEEHFPPHISGYLDPSFWTECQVAWSSALLPRQCSAVGLSDVSPEGELDYIIIDIPSLTALPPLVCSCDLGPAACPALYFHPDQHRYVGQPSHC